MTSSPARSLAAEIRGWDDASLEWLLQQRPDLLSPVPVDMASLATRAGSTPSVARVLDRFNRFELDILEAAAVLHEPLNRLQLAAAVPDARPEAIDAVLSRAGALAVCFGPPDDQRLVRAAIDLLAPAAGGLGPAMAPSHPRLAELLAEPAALEHLLATAPDGARAALEHLLWGPPHGQVADARRSVSDPNDARTPVDWLLAHELLIPVGPDTVVLPREVALRLRQGVVHRLTSDEAPELAVQTHDPDSTGRLAASHAFSAVRLVENLLEAWGLDGPPVLRAGGLGVRDRRRAAGLLDTDEATATLVMEVAYGAGLVAGDGQVEEAFAPTPAYDVWLTRDTAERWVVLVEGWLTMPRVPGLAGTRDERDKALAALGPDLEWAYAPELRATILDELCALTLGAATDAASLQARLEWLHPRRRGRLLGPMVTWTLAEAEILGLTGRGSLAEFGRTLLSEGADGTAQQLAPLLPTPVDHVLLQADLTAVAPGPLESGLAAELALLADVESTGGATVYRFTPSSVRRALDAGRSAGDVHALLATKSKTPVPQPLTYLIDDVARRHGQIRVGAASAYIRCDDESVLNELIADKRSSPLRLRRLAPTVLTALVPVDHVLNELRTMGYAPAAESTDGSLVVRRPDTHRTPPRQRLPRLSTPSKVPGDTLVSAAVRAIRAGERASTAPRRQAVGGRLGGVLPRSTAGQTLQVLRRAVATRTSVWIGYVDNHGGVSERVVDPLTLAGGYLTAFDHRLDAMHTFAVHRVTGVAELTEGDVDPDAGDNDSAPQTPEGAA